MLIELPAFDPEHPPRVPRPKVLINPQFVAAVQQVTLTGQQPGINGGTVPRPLGEAIVVFLSNGQQVPLALDADLSRLTDPDVEPWKRGGRGDAESIDAHCTGLVRNTPPANS